MRIEIAVRPLAVDVGQGRVVRTGAGDHHVVDRLGQVGKEPVECGRIGDVEGRSLPRADLGGSVPQALGVAAGQDDIGALGAGPAGGFEPDAAAAADHHDGLPGQFRLALAGGEDWCGGHDSSDYIVAAWSGTGRAQSVAAPCSARRLRAITVAPRRPGRAGEIPGRYPGRQPRVDTRPARANLDGEGEQVQQSGRQAPALPDADFAAATR